jgi:hypothetical protein
MQEHLFTGSAVPLVRTLSSVMALVMAARIVLRRLRSSSAEDERDDPPSNGGS